MNAIDAENLVSASVPHSWTIILALAIVALVALFSWLGAERDEQGNWKRGQFSKPDSVDNWGPLE